MGLLGMFFAYELGRVWIRQRRQGLPLAKLTTWVLRTAVAVFAILYTGGLDPLGAVLLALMVLLLALGAYMEWRPKRTEPEVHLFGDRP